MTEATASGTNASDTEARPSEVALNALVGNLSPLEKAWIAIKRFNEQEPKREVNWCKQIRRLKVTYRWRSKNCLWGRFGGGWNWELGVQVRGRTTIIKLLVCSIRIEIANAGGQP